MNAERAISSATTQTLTPEDAVGAPLGVREQARDHEQRVAGQQEADEQAGLGEDDEAHHEQRPGAGRGDDRLGVEPGDEGDVDHRLRLQSSDTADAGSAGGVVSLQSTQRMSRPTGIDAGKSSPGMTPAPTPVSMGRGAARGIRSAQSARASKTALFMRNEVRTSSMSTSTSSGDRASAFMASR